MGYTFNRLEGRAKAQILPFVQNGAFQLGDTVTPEIISST